MESLLESTDYDRFDHKHADEPPLTLEEAVRKAAALRRTERSKFHRIVPTDENMASFRVESVSKDEAYAEFLARANSIFNRFLRLGQKRWR